MLDTFYATVGQVCFALLGLWWVVVQFKHHEWMRSPRHRRMAFNVSHYFIVPGIMCLVALLADNAKTLWQLAFILAGLLGAVETVSIISNADVAPLRPRSVQLGGWAQLILYLLVILLACDAALGLPVGLPLTPLEVEGVVVSLLLFLGVNLAWTFFAQVEQEH